MVAQHHKESPFVAGKAILPAGKGMSSMAAAGQLAWSMIGHSSADRTQKNNSCHLAVFQPAFLEAFAGLKPDLAVTAAYGNMLPTAFLNIPKHGVLNIHPSLLPKYRGAAPVQRAVEVRKCLGLYIQQSHTPKISDATQH